MSLFRPYTLRYRFALAGRFSTIIPGALLLLFLWGCDSGGPDEPDTDPSAIDVEETADAVTAISDNIRAVSPPPETPVDDRNLRTELVSAAQAARSSPMVDTVIVHDSFLTATVRLENGVPFVIGRNRVAGTDPSPVQPEAETTRVTPPSSSTGEPGSREDQPVRARAASEPATFPRSKKAVVQALDGGAAQASRVERKLREAGYQISPLGASVQDMRNYDDLGVLYLDQHGAAFQGRPEGDGSEAFFQYALQTSTKPEDLKAWLEQNESAVLDGKLVLSCFGTDCNPKVAVTGSFIAEHWDFADGAFVMIHACLLGSDQFTVSGTTYDPSRIRDDILDSAGALVSFDGYTLTSYAAESITAVFDLLLGTDEEKYGRPWRLQSAQGALGKQGLNRFFKPSYVAGIVTRDGSYINVTYHGDASVQLAPSLRRIDVIDDAAQSQGRLHLKGQFGNESGKITVGDTELSVDSWSAGEVVALAPFSGPGSTGPVKAELPSSVESNEVNLTYWQGTMTGQATSRSYEALTAESTIDVAFRADVHASRERPLAAPSYPTSVSTYISPASAGTLEGDGEVSTDGGTTYWEGSSTYSILPKDRVDGTAGGATRQSTVDPLPTEFGGKVIFRPDPTSSLNEAEICFRMFGSVTNRQVASDGSETTVPVNLQHGLALAENGNADGGAASLACVPLNWSGPLDNTMTRSRMTAQLGGLDYTVNWLIFEASNRPD